MTEQHIKCGNKERMFTALEKAGVRKSQHEISPFDSLYGMKIIVDETIPENEARLISSKGEIIQTFNI